MKGATVTSPSEPIIRRRPGRCGWWARVKPVGARRSNLKKFATDAQGCGYAAVQIAHWSAWQAVIADAMDKAQRRAAASARSRPILGSEGAVAGWICSEEMRRNTPGHRRHSRQWVERFARDTRARTLYDITEAGVVRWQHTLGARGLAPQTIRQARTRLGTFLRWCHHRGWVDHIATQGVPHHPGYGEPRQTPGALTVAQYAALLDATPDRYRALRYALGGSAGLRLCEIDRLRWEDLDLQNGWMRVPAGAKNTGKSDPLPIVPALVERAAALRPSEKSGPVFRRPAGRYTWQSDLIRAGIVAVRWTGPPRIGRRGKPRSPNLQEDEHELCGGRDALGRALNRRCLRRTFGTHLALAGVAISLAAKLMRYPDPGMMLEFYTDGRQVDPSGAAGGWDDLHHAAGRVATTRA